MVSQIHTPTTDKRPVVWIFVCIVISWLGEFIHNRIELPQITLFSPENSMMAVLGVALFLLWWRLPGSKVPAVLLLGLGVLHLVGGAVISVIPFKFLPYDPEQSLQHYFTHFLYGLAQLPLIAVMFWQIFRRRK